MYIESFHIDGFGIFSGVTVEGIPLGLSIFFGENEAGKSTCLEFLRATLAGYPDRRSGKAWEPYETYLQGNKAGGSLSLLLQNGEKLRLTRLPGAGGGTLRLGDCCGKTLPPTYWHDLMRGINRDVYNAVFGFSLSELQNFERLGASEVRNALYSASFGPGLVSPAVVLGGLHKEMERIFKQSGTNPTLNAAFKELESIRRRLGELKQQTELYNDIARKLEQSKDKLAVVRRDKSLLEEEGRKITRRIGVWQQWQERHIDLARLQRLENVQENFPEDAPARLAALETERRNYGQQLADCREKLTRLEGRRGTIAVNPILQEEFPLLRSLAERKNSCREALEAIPAQTEECRRSAANLKAELVCLGRSWTCSRIRAVDRSILARENFEKQAKAIAAAALAHDTAQDTLRTIDQEVAMAQEDLAGAMKNLALLPKVEGVLTEEERDKVRKSIDRREDNLRLLPERQRNFSKAKALFMRAFEPLHFKETADPAEILGTTLNNREEALYVSEEVQKSQQETEKLEEAVSRAENSVQDLRLRKKLYLEELQRNPHAFSRKSIDDRESMLDELRGKAATLDMERSRLEELDERIASETPPSQIKNMPLMLSGLALALAGVAMMSAHWQFGVTSLALIDQLVIPITPWVSYLALVCAAILLVGGAPRKGPEAKRHRLQMAQLQQSRKTFVIHVRSLEDRILQLCTALAIENQDPVTLDAVALRLKAEREKMALEEQNRKIINELDREIKFAQARQEEAITQRDKHMSGRIQQIRRRWQEIMLSLGLSLVPSAESAVAFFARVETAKVALDAFEEARDLLLTLEGDIILQEDCLRTLKPVSEQVRNAEDGEELKEIALRILENCRATDARREEVIRADASVVSGENALKMCLVRKDAAAQALEEIRENSVREQEKWNALLDQLGLGFNLEPDAVREAFNRMDKCLALEEKLLRNVEERRRGRKAVQALRDPLAKLLAKLGQTPHLDIDGQVNWPTSLDTALKAAEEALAAAVELENLDRQLTEERRFLQGLEEVLRESQTREGELFHQAGARDANDFLRLDRIRTERFDLVRNIQQKEDMLRLAAKDEPFDDFLGSFNLTDQERQESRLSSLKEDLDSLGDEEEKLEESVAVLSSRVSALECADELANLQQQEASLLESVEEKAREWSKLAIAKELLKEAKKKFEQERQPKVIRRASEIFSDITQRWSGISTNLDDASLSILPRHGAPVSPEILSRGTQEQAYLALRLAYIVNHSAEAEPLPVIMDEILVNFDPHRAERTARALVEMAEGRSGQQHQMLYFTCQPHIVEMLRKVAPKAAIFGVNDGKIQPA